jgi:uncharacterized protein (DUF2141 family)
MNFKSLKQIIFIFGIIFLIQSCANRGTGPTGGPKDTIPPQVVKSFPPFGSLNYKKKQIQIYFNEMVSVDKPSENVIISPPQIKPPDVKAYSKYVTVNFNEDLKDSTTYTINFGKAIVDLNENNALKNYMFSFSTGNEIDTLQVSGVVINAEDLNPLSGIVVGVYRETSDSVFFKKPFMRICKTDDKGHFTIYNMKKGKYKLFALDDTNHDYFYESGEELAMSDSIITPIFRREEMRDTIWKDSVHIDSVRKYMGTRFLPDNLVLQFFKENKKRQYFVKAERLQPFTFSLYFNAPAAKLPEIKPINFKWEGKYLLQKNNTKDSLTFWITDSLIWNIDTLRMAMTYLKSDSLYHLKPVTDTLNISMRKARVNPRAKHVKKAPVKIEPLRITNNIASSFDVYSPIFLNFDAPLSEINVSKIKLRLKKDTVYKEIPFKWRQVDSTKMAYAIDYKWVPEKSYQLKIDSASFISIYHKTSSQLKSDFKIKSLDEYSSIKMILEPFNPKAMLQVLDSKDALLATNPASEKGTLFQYLKPGDYYVRMFIDSNGNGKWDTGDLSTRRQPEEVYYYPKKLTLKANWDFEETWDYKQVSILKQKPTELKKLAVKKTQNN